MKRLFITGASKGIGEAIANLYSKHNSELFLFARNGTALKNICDKINASGGKAYYYAGDVTNLDDVAQAVKQAESSMGGIDIAFLNAGISEHTTIRNFDLNNYRRTLDVNFFGVANFMDKLIPIMKRQNSGIIVGVSSLASFRATPGSSSYSASKIALDYLLESARMELAGIGIHVITVRFGFVKTDIIKKNNFKMPFLMEADECARRIKKGVDKRKRKIQFPLPMLLLTKFARIVPEVLYEKSVKFRIKDN